MTLQAGLVKASPKMKVTLWWKNIHHWKAVRSVQ